MPSEALLCAADRTDAASAAHPVAAYALSGRRPRRDERKWGTLFGIFLHTAALVWHHEEKRVKANGEPPRGRPVKSDSRVHGLLS